MSIPVMDAELRGMVMNYRVAELQALLGFAGKNKSGRKNELQARCLELVRTRSPPIVLKIKELYRSIQLTTLGQPLQNIDVYDRTASSLTSRNDFGRSIGYQKVITVDGQYRTVPLCPDITLKELPFYDILGTLIQPTSLLNQGQAPKQESQHPFCLTPLQASQISSSREMVIGEPGPTGNPTTKIQYTVQIQLRFCAVPSDTSEEQDDLFPPGLQVKVNSRLVTLPHPIPSNRPGVEPKRPSKPLNITNNVKMCPHSTNTISVQWVNDANKCYAMSVNIVKRLTADELFQRLKTKRVQPADFTRGRIKEITSAEEDDLCAPTSIGVTVACPLGKSRMSYPCRSTSCKHLQCFDAQLFLLMNEKKPTFICPVCNKHLKFGELTVDGFFLDVIQKLSIDAGNEIELYPDGSWVPAIKIKSEVENLCPPSKRLKIEEPSDQTSANKTVDLDDDICIVEEDVGPSKSGQNGNANSSKQKAEPEVIDLIDSSDEEEESYSHNNHKETESSRPSTATVRSPEMEPEQAKQADDEEEDDDDDDEEEIGIRPRRRAARVNYVEDSSSDSSTTNEGTKAASSTKSKSKRPLSPTFIELSDSPSTSPERAKDAEPQRRAFASVSGMSSSRSSASSTSSSQANNRSGSGTTSLYSSSAMGTTPTIPANPTPTGIGGMVAHHNSTIPTPGYFSSTSTFTSSLSSAPNINPSPSPLVSTSSVFYSSTSSGVPGYTAYDARANWEADLNSYMNTQLNYGQMEAYDYLSRSVPNPHHYPGYDPRSGGSNNSGAGAGTGYPRWM